MSFTAELRSWFFRTAAPLNVRGAKINIADKGEPDQDLMERLTESIPFKKESADRAKTTTGGALEAEVGIVAVGTDAAVKDLTISPRATGLEADRTIIPHMGQLPTVDIGPDQAITGTNVPLSSSALVDVSDDTTATRNNFVVTITAALLGWYQAVSDHIDEVFTDVSEIRTTTGTSDGDTDLGAFIAPGNKAGILDGLTDTVKAALQRIGNYLGDIGALNPSAGAWVNITPNATILEAIEDLDAAVTGGTGTVTGGSHIGTAPNVPIYNSLVTAGGPDLKFNGIATSGAYLNVLENLGTFNAEISLDYAALELQLDTVYVKQTSEKNVATFGGGAYDIYAGYSAPNERIKSLNTSSSIDISDAGGILSFSVNQTWLDAQILAGGAPGALYLFNALKTTEQSYAYNHIGSELITFSDDVTNGNYDYGNTWLVSNWTANADADTDNSSKFNASITVELTTVVSGGNMVVTVTIFKNGATVGASDSATFTTGNAVGDTFTLQPAYTLTPIVAGDTIDIRVSVGGGGGGTFKINTNSRIWNEE